MATTYYPIVQQLADMIKNNPGWEEKFNEAIAKTVSYNIVGMEDIKDIPSFLNWINNFVKWVPFENRYGSLWLEKLCKFYFVFDQSPVKELQTPEVPAYPQPALSPLSQWLKDFMIKQGEFLDTPESLTPETLQTFKNAPDYNFDEYVEPHGGWKTSNEFFARHFKPGYRPKGGIFRWGAEAFGSRWGWVTMYLEWMTIVIWFPAVLMFGAVSLASAPTSDTTSKS